MGSKQNCESHVTTYIIILDEEIKINMWLLKDADGKITYLKANSTMTVSRSKGDIVLKLDGSISRNHANITVKTVEDTNKIIKNGVPLSTCTIKDPGSKYGNFIVNDGTPEIKIPKGEEGYSVKHMDKIRFGLQNYIYTFIYIPIITITSGMSEPKKEELKKIIDAIDGIMVYNWISVCTHMTVTKDLVLSEKISCALATQTPIVPMDYWKCVLKAVQANEELPNPTNYAGLIDVKHVEGGKNLIVPDPRRKTLFNDLIFVHFDSKQFKLYSRMIELAGGKSVVYTTKYKSMDVCSNRVVIVLPVESSTTQASGTGDVNYAAVSKELGKCRRRAIPESEIALAILFTSTEKNCNPNFDYANLFKKREKARNEMPGKLIALDTQDVEANSSPASEFPKKQTSDQNKEATRHPQNYIIPETVLETMDITGETTQKKDANESKAITKKSQPQTPSQTSFDFGSMKVATLRYEDHLLEDMNNKFVIDAASSTKNQTKKREQESSVEEISIIEHKKSNLEIDKNKRANKKVSDAKRKNISLEIDEDACGEKNSSDSKRKKICLEVDEDALPVIKSPSKMTQEEIDQYWKSSVPAQPAQRRQSDDKRKKTWMEIDNDVRAEKNQSDSKRKKTVPEINQDSCGEKNSSNELTHEEYDEYWKMSDSFVQAAKKRQADEERKKALLEIDKKNQSDSKRKNGYVDNDENACGKKDSSHSKRKKISLEIDQDQFQSFDLPKCQPSTSTSKPSMFRTRNDDDEKQTVKKRKPNDPKPANAAPRQTSLTNYLQSSKKAVNTDLDGEWSGVDSAIQKRRETAYEAIIKEEKIYQTFDTVDKTTLKQPLLRISESTESAPKFKKRFQKQHHTVITKRIEFEEEEEWPEGYMEKIAAIEKARKERRAKSKR